jgi:hypothetical protein
MFRARLKKYVGYQGVKISDFSRNNTGFEFSDGHIVATHKCFNIFIEPKNQSPLIFEGIIVFGKNLVFSMLKNFCWPTYLKPSSQNNRNVFAIEVFLEKL